MSNFIAVAGCLIDFDQVRVIRLRSEFILGSQITGLQIDFHDGNSTTVSCENPENIIRSLTEYLLHQESK